MEYLVFGMAVILFLLYVFVQGYMTQRKQLKWMKEKLLENFGQRATKEIKVARMETLPGYYNAHKREGDIDEITWNDLSMDDVFHRMDYTLSSVGEECLYARLHTRESEEELKHFDKLVRFFREDEKIRTEYLMLMYKLGTTGNYSMYDYLHYLNELDAGSSLKKIIPIVSLIVSTGMLFVNVSIGMIMLIMFMVINIVSYFKEKSQVEPYLVSLSYVMRLLKISEKVVTLKLAPFEGEVEEMKKAIQELQGLKKGSILAPVSGKTGGNPLDIIFDYFRMITHIDILAFYYMRSQIITRMEAIDCLFTNVGTLESAISVCYFRESIKEWTNPTFGEEEIDVENVYHPLLDEPVTNSIKTNRSVLLTGSNASGKSTFLKTIAINTILGQTIYTVAAKRYATPYFVVFSAMSLKDNLKNSESYYIVEIKAIKRILDATDISSSKVLCFVDEVLRGTNTVERIAASSQILKTLEEKGAFCFAATHDIELTYLLEGIYENYHFDEDMKGNDISFSYELKNGRATTRNAIKLLDILGYEKEIIEKSSEQANVFMEQGIWKLCR